MKIKIIIMMIIMIIIMNKGKEIRKEKRKNVERVREMILFTYEAYIKYGFPSDEVRPKTCIGRDRKLSESRGTLDESLGNYMLTLVDSLETLAFIGEGNLF